MARRYRQQRTSPFEDMILISSRLPWWACLLLGLISYLVLQVVASRPLMQGNVGPEQLGAVMAGGILTTFAMLAKLIIPAGFVIAAIISAVAEYKRKKSGTFIPNYLDTEPQAQRRASREPSPLSKGSNAVSDNLDFKEEIFIGETSQFSEKSKPNPLPQDWSESVLQMIEWKRFEIVTREFLNMTGYEARETNVGADGGVDIRVTKTADNTFRGIVQCKAWNAYRVGVKPVRELYGVMAAEKVTAGMLITSGAFTAEAEEFAKGKVRLISGVNFLELIRKLPMEKQRQLLEIALEGDFQTPTCPQCDLKMTLRENKSGKNAGSKFWGCVRYPRCRQTLVYGET